MTVFCKQKGHKLGVHLLVAAEVSAEETADQVSIDRSVIAREMDIFKAAEKAFKICSEFLYLGGLSCPVQAFKDYKHCVFICLSHKDSQKISRLRSK